MLKMCSQTVLMIIVLNITAIDLLQHKLSSAA